MRINVANILLPVSVKPFVCLLRDRRDPDCVYTEALDVVQFVDNSLEAAATVVPDVRTWRAITAGFGEAIGQNLQIEKRTRTSIEIMSLL